MTSRLIHVLSRGIRLAVLGTISLVAIVLTMAYLAALYVWKGYV